MISRKLRVIAKFRDKFRDQLNYSQKQAEPETEEEQEEYGNDELSSIIKDLRGTEQPQIQITESHGTVSRIPLPTQMIENIAIQKDILAKIRQVNEKYPLIHTKTKLNNIPLAFANIFYHPQKNQLQYFILEPYLDARLGRVINKTLQELHDRLEIDFNKVKEPKEINNYINKEIDEIWKMIGFQPKPYESIKLKYYIFREALGLGKIDALAKDQNIEDISCDGVGLPIYIYHRNPLYGEVATNIIFHTKDELDSFAMRLAQKCNRTISVANPLMDGSLPDGSRVQITYGTDIARRGSNFTIRKFFRKPLTPVDIITFGTASPLVLAYLWIAIEREKSILIAGTTATGKTTFLNVLSLFIEPNQKIVSIEDSVTGDTEFIFKDSEGYIKKQQIGAFIDEQIKQNSAIKSIQGHEICAIDSKIKVASVGSDNKTKFSKVKSLIRHKTAKDVYEITTKSGKTIKVTEDHSLFTLGNNAELKKIKPAELKENSFIVGIQKLPCANLKIKEINILKHIDKLDKTRFFVADDRIPELIVKYRSEFLKYLSERPNPAATLNWWRRKRIMRLDAAVKVLDLNRELPDCRIKLGHSKPIPSKIKLNSAFLEMLGLWIADGCFDHSTKSVVISAPQKENIKVIKNFCKDIGLAEKTHSDGFSHLIHSRALYYILKDVIGLKHYARTKRVPELIYSLDKKQIAAFLRGYLAGDCSNSCYEIGAASQSKKLLEDISNLLARFDIHARINTKPDKTDTYKLRVSQIENIKRFENIGFIRKNHTEHFNKLVKRKPATHDNSNVLPLPKELLWSIIDESKVLVGDKWTYKTWKTLKQRYKKSFIGKKFLADLATSGVLSEDTLQKINPLIGEDIRFEKIKHIKRIQHTGYVYDLSVEGSEKFISGSQILCSNTAEIQLPHSNWMPQVTRAGFGVAGYGEISMYDLLTAALRQRPDYLIVGEVRGKEANVLFHAMSTGHPGLSTLHADNVNAVIDRLTTRPISLPASLLQNLDIIVFLDKTRKGDKLIRRVAKIIEIEGYDTEKKQLNTNTVFEWDPASDNFKSRDSYVLKRIGERAGWSSQEVHNELMRRVKVFRWMQKNNIFDFDTVANFIHMYYINPQQLAQQIGK